MVKKVVLGLMTLMALSVAIPAAAQRPGPPADAPRLRLGPGSGRDGATMIRIVKGTVERISDDFIVMEVESIFVPREGPMKTAPETVKLAVSDYSHFVRGGEKKASLDDFSIGDAAVALTTYTLEKGYALRVLFDPESAVRLRERIAQRLGGRQAGRPGMGPGGPGMAPGRPDMQPGRPGDMRGRFAGRGLPPVLVGTYLGPADADASVRLKLTGVLVRQEPRPMMRERKGHEAPAPREEGRARGQEQRFREFPEPKEVTVQLTERTRLFADGEKATLRGFHPGDEVVAIIRGRPGAEEGAFLMLMADRESARKLMKLLLEQRQRGRGSGPAGRPAEHGAF